VSMHRYKIIYVNHNTTHLIKLIILLNSNSLISCRVNKNRVNLIQVIKLQFELVVKLASSAIHEWMSKWRVSFQTITSGNWLAKTGLVLLQGSDGALLRL
jgi:hypothetical protein